MAEKRYHSKDARPKEFYEESRSKKVKIPTDEESNGPETINGMIVNSLFVKVRKEPSFESEVVGLVQRNDMVTITGRNDGFYKIITSDKINGYIFSGFVEEV